MPDFQEYSVVEGQNQGGIPRFTIFCRVTDSQNGRELADFRGAKGIQFPSVMNNLTADQRRQIIETIAAKLIEFLMA